MKKLAVFAIGLVIATVIFGVTVAYFYVKSREMIPPHPTMSFMAEEIDKPDEYWVLTDPDKWTRQAVENLEVWVVCDKLEKQTLTRQINEHDGNRNLEYEGSYYYIYYGYGDVFTSTRVTKYDQLLSYVPIGVVVLAALYVVLGSVWFKARLESVRHT